MATTTTTRQPGSEELVDLAQPVTPLSMDLRELELKRRERDVSYLEKAVWKFAQKVEKQELDLCDQFERLKSVDREEARLARLRDLLQGHLDEALSPYLEIEHDKQRRLEKKIDQLEFTNAQLKRERHAAEGRKSDYDRGLTGDRRTDNKIVARKVEEELVRREAELVRHATEEKDFAIRRAQELEGKLARAIATISKLKKKVNIASKCNGKLKEQRDKYRDQLAVAQSLQQGFLPDADDDNPMHGAYDDPEASHVAALREIDRADRNLCNLALTEKKDTATQTDAYASADNGLSVLADGTAIFSAELYKAAQAEYQKYQKLLETASSLQRELEELEVIKASEQARAESLDMERARQLKELDLARRKYLKALSHIQSLQPTAEVIQKMADDANTEFEKVMETYQDPDKYMQFVTLLASDCKLGNNLGGIQMFAGTVVDGLKETDDGMKFVNEEAAVREVLSLQD